MAHDNQITATRRTTTQLALPLTWLVGFPVIVAGEIALAVWLLG